MIKLLSLKFTPEHRSLTFVYFAKQLYKPREFECAFLQNELLHEIWKIHENCMLVRKIIEKTQNKKKNQENTQLA